MLQSWILTLLIALPILGSLALLFVPTGDDGQSGHGTIKMLALAVTGATFLLSLYLLVGYDANSAEPFQFGQIAFREALGAGLDIKYRVGIDGISLLLVVLTTLFGPIVVLSSWTSVEKRIKEYFFFLLLLEAGMIGVFCALDLFLFYIFWEAMLIPMYFLIGIWGGHERIYAAIKFFIYTMAGSLLMLVAIIYVGTLGPAGFTSDLTTLYSVHVATDPNVFFDRQTLLFLAFFASFAIKVPLFPFHTWLPDAHVQAPTAGSVILAGVMLKMGTYGLLRFNLPLFPDASHKLAPFVATLAVIGIVYGALVAMVQKDVKKLVAYSSVSHLGFVVLGIFAFTVEGMQGAVIQMINHGLSTGALFLIIGMIYERRHTRMIVDFGGLAKVMPVFTVLFLIATFSSIGLPGLNGFIGEFLILTGAFKSPWLGHGYAVVAASGVILAAIYMLWMFQRVMFGPLTNPKNEGLKDLNAREIGLLVPLFVLMVWIGFQPIPFMKLSDPTVRRVMTQVETKMNATAHTAALPTPAVPVAPTVALEPTPVALPVAAPTVTE